MTRSAIADEGEDRHTTTGHGAGVSCANARAANQAIT